MLNRTMAFSARNIKELLRDPLSYIFCVGFPLVMLAVMSAINSIIPPEANMTVFQPSQLTPGIGIFGLTFIMLFASLLVSKDNASAFRLRLLSGPMKPADFLLGYTLPLVVLSFAQLLLCFIAGGIIALIDGSPLSVVGSVLSVVACLPAVLFFICTGVLFGTLLNDKTAPPCCSILISLSGIMGGIWFSLDTVPEGNFFGTLCDVLPFSHFTSLGRMALAGTFDGAFVKSLFIALAWTVFMLLLSIGLFAKRREL